jgi:hypothetical protein
MAHIGNVTPSSGRHGDDIIVRITGDGFHHVHYCNFGPGTGVGQITVIEDGIMDVEVIISKNAQRGPRDVLVKAASGDDMKRGGFEIT